jgi:hypothetical protein
LAQVWVNSPAVPPWTRGCCRTDRTPVVYRHPSPPCQMHASLHAYGVSCGSFRLRNVSFRLRNVSFKLRNVSLCGSASCLYNTHCCMPHVAHPTKKRRGGAGEKDGGRGGCMCVHPKAVPANPRRASGSSRSSALARTARNVTAHATSVSKN